MNMFESTKDIEQFRVIQRRTNLFEIQIKKRSEAVDEEVMEKELVVHLQKTINAKKDNLTFEVRFVDRIPFDKTGKFSAVTSDLKKNF
jgi:acyl-CoA synthetase (AMP-forming)/AMP-acid ligase II